MFLLSLRSSRLNPAALAGHRKPFSISMQPVTACDHYASYMIAVSVFCLYGYVDTILNTGTSQVNGSDLCLTHLN